MKILSPTTKNLHLLTALSAATMHTPKKHKHQLTVHHYTSTPPPFPSPLDSLKRLHFPLYQQVRDTRLYIILTGTGATLTLVGLKEDSRCTHTHTNWDRGTIPHKE